MVSTYALNEAAPDALVIHCSDPRFQEAFRRFIKDELKIEHYVPVVIPGSVSSIGIQDLQPKYFKTLYQYLKVLTDVNKVPRIIIINHEDCRGYQSIKGFILARRATIPEQQRRDLRAGAELFNDLLPGSHVELYQSRITEDRAITFEKIL